MPIGVQTLFLRFLAATVILKLMTAQRLIHTKFSKCYQALYIAVRHVFGSSFHDYYVIILGYRKGQNSFILDSEFLSLKCHKCFLVGFFTLLDVLTMHCVSLFQLVWSFFSI